MFQNGCGAEGMFEISRPSKSITNMGESSRLTQISPDHKIGPASAGKVEVALRRGSPNGWDPRFPGSNSPKPLRFFASEAFALTVATTSRVPTQIEKPVGRADSPIFERHSGLQKAGDALLVKELVTPLGNRIDTQSIVEAS